MSGSNGRAPEPFPTFEDVEAVKKAIAERKNPPGTMTPAAFKRWRQKGMEVEADEYVETLMSLGMVKNLDPIYEKVTKGAGLVGGQCERFDFRPLGEMESVNLDNANLRASDWSDMEVRNCKLVKVDFSRACLYRTHFYNCDLSAADLGGAYLKGVFFENCVMPASIYRWARAKHALFVNCDLRSADFAFADLLGAKFWRCQLGGVRHIEYAIFAWYRATDGSGRLEWLPTPGFVKDDESRLGTESVQENAARIRVDE